MEEVRTEASTVIDARGMICPMPLLKLKLALAMKSEGESLELLVSDEGSVNDIPRYLRMVEQPFTLKCYEDGVFAFQLT